MDNSERFNPEHDNRQTVKLSIRDKEDDFGKNYMVEFSSSDTEIVRVYNDAICRTLTGHGLNPFHQIGSGNEKGYHAWEVWKDISRDELGGLLPEIEEQASHLMD